MATPPRTEISGVNNRLQLSGSMRDQAILVLDPDGAVVRWNEGAQRVNGYTAEEAIGSHFSCLYTPEDIAAGKPAHGLDVARTLGCFEDEGWRVRKDGTRFWASISITALHDEHGELEGFSKIVRDITEKKRLREKRERLFAAIDSQRQLFQLVVENAPDGIAVIDGATLRVKWANRPFQERLDEPYHSMDLTGLRVEDYLPHAEEAGILDLFRRVIETGEPHIDAEYAFAGFSQGVTYYRLCLLPLPAEAGEPPDVLEILTDVTDGVETRKKVEDLAAELEARNREVERASRLKSEFLASVSHELRTPLHSITGFADLMAEQVAGRLTEKQCHYVERISRSARHLLSLINDLLDLSRIEAGRLDLHQEYFPAMEALVEVLETITPLAAAKNITIGHSVEADLALVADRTRFKQMLFNLLSNAVKFTAEDGRIEIRASSSEQSVEVSVIDNGIGIPREEQEAIFGEFYQAGETTSGVREGTGLGLAITRRLVESHGGKIWVESEPGKGSCFTLRLPL
ncbi:MAG: ATP-binding protein [Bryobacteraceae bacterium]|jgi:PAS domain S-box-containing protein